MPNHKRKARDRLKPTIETSAYCTVLRQRVHVGLFSETYGLSYGEERNYLRSWE